MTITDVQNILDEFNASLIETTKVLGILEDNGCKIVEEESTREEFDFFVSQTEEIGTTLYQRFETFLQKEKIENIDGLGYDLRQYDTGILYYIYLRLVVKLSRMITRKHIIALQKAYELFLPVAEDKVIFDIESAAFVGSIYDDLKDRKKHGKVAPDLKNSIANYQYFLSQNRHHIIAKCESILTD